MPRKAFLADLEKLQQPGEAGPNITDVQRGDDDGTFKLFFVSPVPGAKRIEITGMIPELSDYPAAHSLYLYTTSPDAPASASSALEKINWDAMSLPDVTATLSKALSKINNTNLDEEDDDDDFDFDAESIGGWSDEGHLDADGDSQMVDAVGNPHIETISSERRQKLVKSLRHDLREAKAAGFKIGVLGDYRGGLDLYVSLGIRVSKLGISDEAMAAWKLDREKYIILLIHYSGYYQDLEKLTDSGGYHASKSVEMCVGTARRYKPSFRDAIAAFSKISKVDVPARNLAGGDSGSETIDKSQGEADDSFEGIFISRPLNELLNSRLIQILRYRLLLGFSWDGAELYYNNNQGRDGQLAGLDAPDEKYYESQQARSILPDIVTGDALKKNDKSISFPLLAMQFTLRHLARCTEFCLVCHNKVSADFEALKPYVCDSSLCLYQYMSLGFGPSIEYEVVSQPTVVDLLISFCYIAAKADKLNMFPDGMDLKVPSTTSRTYQARYHRLKFELVFSEDSIPPPIKPGDWVAISLQDCSTDSWHCRVTESAYYPTIKLGPPISSKADDLAQVLPQNTTQDPPSSPGKIVSGTIPSLAIVPGDQDIIQVQIKVYDTSFDSLEVFNKRRAIVTTLDTLPTTADMKAWIRRSTKVGEEAKLGMWKERVSPTACGVLRWIIASNRSCIVPIEDDVADEAEKENLIRAKIGREEGVLGMAECKQFRFAMGAPDKEQRFVSAVKNAQARLNLTYPSIFAFHGSSLPNWHSIIREGLHFKETVNGRAFGNGCYHSLEANTSMNYSNMPHFASSNPTAYVGWSQSALRISSAISLNEIVNAPNEFVSKTPHLVIDKLDWIQTRYLFVKSRSRNSEDVHRVSYNRPAPQAALAQDPDYTPRGLKLEKLVIPAASFKNRTYTASSSLPEVTPKVKRRNLLSLLAPDGSSSARQSLTTTNSSGSSALNPVILEDDTADDASITTDTSDLVALLSDDENLIAETTQSSKKKDKVKKPTRSDAFIPGSLDTTKIAFLPPPSYASPMATKRLNSDIQSLIKLQESQDLEELGFYINPDLVENVYQWIVELHSFPEHLPLTQDMRQKKVTSIVLELRFGPQYPMSPPFVRVIQPRFLGFNQGGGGHVTIGGALCMELLTNSGWSAVSSVESVLLQVRMAISEEKPAARLEPGPVRTYGVDEARDAFIRACRVHGWTVPDDFKITI